jgi:hypothetical protein
VVEATEVATRHAAAPSTSRLVEVPRLVYNSRNGQTQQGADRWDTVERFGVFQRRGHDVIGYWASKQSDPMCKDLADMALEFLFIRDIVAKLQRVFRSANISVDDRRC